jgi:hypothetical protein
LAERDLVEVCRATMRGERFLYPAEVTAVIREVLSGVLAGEQFRDASRDPLRAARILTARARAVRGVGWWWVRLAEWRRDAFGVDDGGFVGAGGVFRGFTATFSARVRMRGAALVVMLGWWLLLRCFGLWWGLLVHPGIADR